MKLKKRDRQRLLKETLENDPFMTDEALSSHFSVSIQTIRLDRMELAIPELRERIKDVAKQQLDDVKALQPEEVIGEIVDLQLDDRAISILDIQPEQVFAKTGIARGHHLFAQANSLAVAIINDEMALTNKATIRFTRQVRAQERVIAKAEVLRTEKERTVVDVQSFVGEELVFSGEFVMYRSNQRNKNEQKGRVDSENRS
ncbi:transcription factor FapR [Alkalihalobacillus pseudalcaliphilus]|uniref:transcription factor FapR n=1 Tax=Alkalihalobacillus pseudalcaliphilus TaxID=79884 RepID=UPI00064DD6CC|nr:transcription factor FapR [Alkalihalobacillus pseudalcaliphilus]KMK77172.1 fatty acid biosynthesis transcriptional regulator [Alkalihalobacillus pseudalcaliphilus]